MALNPETTRELNRLVAAVAEQQQTPEELQRLKQLVATDADARAYYLRYMGLRMALHWTQHDPPAARVESQQAQSPPLNLVPSVIRYVNQPWAFSWIFATVCLVSAISVMSQTDMPSEISEPRASREAAQPQSKSQPKSQSESQGVARITRTRDQGWQEGRPAAEIYSGQVLRLGSGTTEVKFRSGVVALVTGPARLQVKSDNRVELQSGMIAARVPPGAVGFSVHTPQALVTDLGTLFAVQVQSNETAVHVYQGSVAVAAHHAPQQSDIRLNAGEMLEVLADGSVRRGAQASVALIEGGPLSLEPAPKLIAHWPLDEGAGDTAIDRAGNHDGRIVGGTYVDLSRGALTALKLSGKQQFVQMGEVLNHSVDQPLTIVAWVQGPPQAQGGLDAALVGKMQHKNSYAGYELHVNTSDNPHGPDRLTFWIIRDYGQSALIVHGSQPVLDGNWHHVAVSYNGSQSARGVQLFVDGSPDLNVKVTADNLKGEIDTPARFSLGSRDAGAGHTFRGLMSDVRIYNDVLSAEQISEIITAAP